MKHGSGIKVLDDKSSGILVEIRMADVLAKINPTDPLILAKQAARRNLNWSDSSGISLARAEVSRWACRNSKRLKSSYTRVYCNGHESYWFWAIDVQLSIMVNLCPHHRPQSSIMLGGTIRAPGVWQLSKRRQLWSSITRVCQRKVQYECKVTKSKRTDILLFWVSFEV